MSYKQFAGTLLAATMLAACATQGGDLELSAAPNFGEAHRYNVAVQTINPDPVYGLDGAQPGNHGERSAAAVKRYRTGDVTDVEVIETSSGTSGSPR